MAQIIYNAGCEPDNPIRPKTEIIQLIRRERAIEVLTELREALEAAAGKDIKDKTIIGFWFILSDLANMLGLTPAEQKGIMGEYVTWLLEDVTAETWQVCKRALNG